MITEPWNCRNCGQRHDAAETLCTKCGMSSPLSNVKPEDELKRLKKEEDADPVVSLEQGMKQLLKRQLAMEKKIEEIRSEVGCIYIVVFVIAILFVISVLASVFN